MKIVTAKIDDILQDFLLSFIIKYTQSIKTQNEIETYTLLKFKSLFLTGFSSQSHFTNSFK